MWLYVLKYFIDTMWYKIINNKSVSTPGMKSA